MTGDLFRKNAYCKSGKKKGVVSRIENTVNENGGAVIRIWCGAHQLDLAVQKVLAALDDRQWLKDFTTLIAYLRRQQSFNSEMGQCPRFAATRWLSCGNTCKYLTRNCLRIKAYLEARKNDPTCAPPPQISASWWMILHALHQLLVKINLAFTCVQGKSFISFSTEHRAWHAID
jgi:hypothetical protein